MDLSPEQLDTAVRTAIGEGDNQGPDGLAGIIWTFRNRAEWKPTAWWGSSVSACCVHPAQYSCWLPGPDLDRIKAISNTSPDYLKVADIVQAVMDGTIPDPTGGATTYKVRGTPASWDHAVENIPPRSIGAHDFWRLGPNGVCYEPTGLGGTNGSNG